MYKEVLELSIIDIEKNFKSERGHASFHFKIK